MTTLYNKSNNLNKSTYSSTLGNKSITNSFSKPLTYKSLIQNKDVKNNFNDIRY